MFSRKRPWEKELDNYCYALGSAIVQVASGSMPADFLEFSIDNQMHGIRGCYQQAVDEGTEDRMGKSVHGMIKRNVGLLGSAVGISTYSVEETIEAVTDRIVRECRAGQSPGTGPGDILVDPSIAN